MIRTTYGSTSYEREIIRSWRKHSELFYSEKMSSKSGFIEIDGCEN